MPSTLNPTPAVRDLLLEVARRWVAEGFPPDPLQDPALYSTSANPFLYAAERAWTQAAAEVPLPGNRP